VTVAASIEEIRALYERWGQEHYDEELSQLSHALQTAALAESSGAPDALIAAALLHDVGHLLELRAGTASTAIDRRHQVTGPAYLAGLFPPEVTAPIALHVDAKRYLCAIDPTYHATLSAGSVRSLERQGGPMDAAEVATFEARPGSEDAVSLRRWDDLGKVDGLDAGDFDRHLRRLQLLISAPARRAK
jgi:phosphonate degradation associated HDIG domain protein